jgi:hypothetical protein
MYFGPYLLLTLSLFNPPGDLGFQKSLIEAIAQRERTY